MHTQSLDGRWQVGKSGSSETIPASVPGSIHIDLLNAGVIPDPFYGDNEIAVSWVSEEDWVYQRTFEPDSALPANDRVYLEFDGLDTLAAIRLNGEEIARTDNMHRRYSFDVTGKLVSGSNSIEVELASPLAYVRERLANKDDLVISPSDSIPGGPYMRKAMYQWGWDWAPAMPTSGIWRSVRLTGCSHARLADVRVHQHHDENGVTLSVRTDIERFSDAVLEARVTLTSPGGDSEWKTATIRPEEHAASTEFIIEYPQLWWPNGYGDQPLYHLEVELILAGDSQPLDSRSLRVGLRKLELRQNPDEWGRSFYFAVNDVPIYAKGADWIPSDQFPSRVSNEQYRDLIESAASANMNMFRVWGGGIYEDDRFYDLCDEYGILIWQDFMFACAHYPVDEDFLENVRHEAADNIRRIRHHPCLALWCGNNEMEWFYMERWLGLDDDARRPEYLTIFYELLPEVWDVEDPDTPYWPASPASAVPFDDPNGEREGDSHYWEVWHGQLPFTAYRQHYPRFMSEFGFESLPSIETVKTFAAEKDWNMTSYIMEMHQKNEGGNGLILYYMAQTFRFPSSFPMMVYVSQMLQAEAMRYGVEHWRRNRNGHRCMGTTYWQYNDCWPVASWSSVEYNGRWKALQYFARRFYAPVLLSVEETSCATKLHVTNDLLKPFHGEVRWSLEKLDGTKLEEGRVKANIPPESDARIADLDFSGWMKDGAERETVLAYELWRGDERVSLGLASFVPSKHLELPEARISSDIVETDGRTTISLTSDVTARFVMLDVPDHDVRLSDNFFDLPSGRTVTITVEKADGLNTDEIRRALKIVSLSDSY